MAGVSTPVFSALNLVSAAVPSHPALSSAALALASAMATAQPIPGQGFNRVNIVKLLNLDDERGGKVQAILENAHVRMRTARQQIGRPTDDTTRSTLRAAMTAIRDETDRQLATVLTADELERLMDVLPPPRPPI